MKHELNWIPPLRSYEAVLIEALQWADEQYPLKSRLLVPKSAVKQQLTALIRRALIDSELPLAPAFSGNADLPYLIWPGTAVLRVKGLDENGHPANYPTDTALQYSLGDDVDYLPGLPPLPRVDVSYRIDELTFMTQAVELLEWQGKFAVRRYQLPIHGRPREVEQAEDLPFTPRPTEIRPRKDAMARRKKNRPQKGTDGMTP